MASALLSFKSKRSPAQNAALAFIVLFISFAAFGVIPTQWFAATYQYDPNLGEALYRSQTFAVYVPTDWVEWGWRLADIEVLRDNVHVMLMMGLSSVILAIFFALFVAYQLSKYTKGMEGLHGTAHWAEKEDINKTGFLSAPGHVSKGVVVGSVMKDSGGRIIHPHHKKFANRYRQKYTKAGEKGIKRFRKIEARDKDGRLIFVMRKSVISTIEALRDGGNTHIFAFCPTRSGKGVGMVLPTLLMYPDSVMVNDPKGEAYALTAGFRKAAGNYVIKFEPSCTDGTGACWNALDEIRAFTVNDVSDTQIIMSMVCDPKGEGLEDHWAKTSFAFLVGVALHLRYRGGEGSSMAGISTYLQDPRWESDAQIYEDMLQYEHDPEGKMGWKDAGGKPTKTHQAVAKAAKTMMNKEDKERTSVLSTAISFFSLYEDETVAKNTSRSDFQLRDLMTGDKPVSLYYVVGPADMERMVPLTRLFYALFLRRNATDMKFEEGTSAKNYTYPLLMIIDEMPSLRKLPILQEGLGYVAGYGIRMFMLAQDITQIEEIYGDKQAIDSGAATRVVYAPNKIETAEKLARMSGKTTITEEKASHSKDLIGIKAGSVSLNTDKIARDLMTADEFLSLSQYDVVVFVAGQPPIYGRKFFYYENDVLLARAKIAPPKMSDVLRKLEVVEAEKVEVVEAKPVPTDKWAASRLAFQASVAQAVQPEVKPEGGKAESAEVKVAEKPKSRYAGQARRVLTDEDRAQIAALTKGVVSMNRVAAVEAF